MQKVQPVKWEEKMKKITLNTMKLLDHVSVIGNWNLIFYICSFPGGKVRPGRAADHSPPASAAVMEE